MSITFSHPQYLLLLPLILAYTWWVMRGSMADLERTRARLAMALRVLLLGLLVLGLAGMQLVRSTTTLCTVFVVDVSDSIAPAERKVVLEYIRRATRQMKSGDRAALVAFGAEALLDHAPENRDAIQEIIAVPTTSRTDIAAGIQLAMATFPPESGRQIVLFTDGNENLGNAVEQAGLARTSNVRISVVPLARDVSRGEALVARVDSPQQVKEGAPFQVSVLLESLVETEGRLTLYRNETPVAARTVRLQPGKTVVVFEQSVPDGGVYRFHALLDLPSGQDTVPDNNIGFAYTRVTGTPRLLIVEGTPGDGRHLARSLRASDLEVELGGPHRIPASLAECAHYDAIVFANVPAWRMSPAQMAIIRSAVRDTGMGFAMVGGEESFGAGGYHKTPVEDALPVTMDMKKQKSLPSLTLVIVIDISGSMTMLEDGVAKIRLAAEAAATAVELLQPIDKVCVVGFDTRPVVTVPMQSAKNKQAIINQVLKLQPGGGGIVAYPALQDAYERIRDSDTQIKHVILCADAADTEVFSAMERAGCMEVARKMRREKISLSVIGFGNIHDPDVRLQQEIAQAAEGQWYLAERMSNLPQIFSRDVMFAAKSLLVEEPFRAHLNDATHPTLQGIAWGAAPPLLGYVATSPRDMPSRLLLTSHKDDPVLAAGPYGLGRSLAFTSDATAHWGAHWLGWEGYSTLWAQSLRWLLRQGGKSDLQTTLVEEGGRVKIVVEAISNEGEYRNLLNMRAHIAHVRPSSVDGPRATREVVTLEQTAPGRYEASFESRDTGAYLVTIEERDGDRVTALQNLTLAIPYSPEFQAVKPNLSLLEQVAQHAQGTVAPPAGDIFGKLRFGSRTLQHLWPLLLTLLAILFLIDVAVRRVLLPRDEFLALAREAIHARLPAWRGAGRVPAQRPATTVGSLLSVKEKRRAPLGGEGSAENPSPLQEQARVPREQPTPPPATGQKPPPSAPAAGQQPAPPAPSSTASSLLRKKRERSGQ